MWWLNTSGNFDLPSDAFYAAGAGCQNTIVVPSRDLVVVRLTRYDSLTLSNEPFNVALRGILAATDSEHSG